MIRQNALVKFDYSNIADNSIIYKQYFDVFEYDMFVFLGEIAQMPGHCIVVNYYTGKVVCGYHTDDFYELSEDEC